MCFSGPFSQTKRHQSDGRLVVLLRVGPGNAAYLHFGVGMVQMLKAGNLKLTFGKPSVGNLKLAGRHSNLCAADRSHAEARGVYFVGLASA